MSETANIAEIAEKISADIFRAFHWEIHPERNANFACVHQHHKTPSGEQKAEHPGDVVFHYLDPYLDKRLYLHTDLKSYKKSSLRRDKLKEALSSLAITTECANVAEQWRKRYCISTAEHFEVRGLLFVANHDNKAASEFGPYLNKINRSIVPLAQNQMVYTIGPERITDLYSIATDIKLLKADHALSEWYRFLYPDLTMWKRRIPDDVRTAATIETLLSPYFILQHKAVAASAEQQHQGIAAGSIVYYSRPGDTVEEFVYLLDALSRHQLVNSTHQIRIRVYNSYPSESLRSNFQKAKYQYCEAWHFSEERAQEVLSISIDTVQRAYPNYSPAQIGWRE